MEYFDGLLAIFNFPTNIKIENDFLYCHSPISVSKYEEILSHLRISFIIFQSDIEIYEILMSHKKYIKYDIKDHRHTITDTNINMKYGVTIKGLLKRLFSIHISNNYSSNLLLYSTCKYLRKRIFKEIDLSNIKLVGKFNNEFIILNINNEIYFIDQHGLHERILYERFTGNEKTRKSRACRKAVKFGDVLDEIFIEYLLNEMKKCAHPFICAHGRPIISKIDL
ncbi:DNA mismatch repair protein mutl (MUTL) [Vairimorpha necatrix]|uniref:DNA mismatch repair protein mutl (MUTL) n=1 Tax=Vairimorpha necatrix TaxID=6039 RepID=A0AAX4JA60_9MICR